MFCAVLSQQSLPSYCPPQLALPPTTSHSSKEEKMKLKHASPFALYPSKAHRLFVPMKALTNKKLNEIMGTPVSTKLNL